MAALEGEREHARKRKERRDSGCAHERKERRPHSEERPPPPPPLHDSNRLETERRAERLSRARRPNTGKRRRAGARTVARVVELEPRERRVSPSPTRLDPAAPRHHDDPTVEWSGLNYSSGADGSFSTPTELPEMPTSPTPPSLQTDYTCLASDVDVERRLHKIRKKIHSLKKVLAVRADEACGSAEDVETARLRDALRRLQLEKRSWKAAPAECAARLLAAAAHKQHDERLEAALRSDRSMAELVCDIEQWLAACRTLGGRAGPVCSWSTTQLAAEKLCVQRALLRLEAARGRPPTQSAERGTARPLYDLYRQVKRDLAARNELATILEHEALPSGSDSTPGPCSPPGPEPLSPSSGPLSPSSGPYSPPSSGLFSPPSPAPFSPPSPPTPPNEETEGLHCLSPEQLARLLSETRLQKCALRRTLRAGAASGAPGGASSGATSGDDYARYKTVKARLRLITALVSKYKTTEHKPQPM